MIQTAIKFLTWLNTLNFEHWIILFSGITIGVILSYIIYLFRRKKLIRYSVSHPAETLLIVAVIITLTLQIFFKNEYSNNAETLLSFIATMGFSWILTKYSVGNEYKDKQKESSAISYKHSASIEKKLIDTIEQLNQIAPKEECHNCGYIAELKNIKNQLNIIQQDVKDNKHEWSVNIAEELRIYHEMEENSATLYNLEDKQEKSDEEKKKINDLKKENSIKFNSINPKVYHSIYATKKDTDKGIYKLLNDRVNKNNLRDKYSSNTNKSTAEEIKSNIDEKEAENLDS